MRISARNQICDILSTLYEGVEYAATARFDSAIIVLEDCELAVGTVREALKIQLTENRAKFYDEHATGISNGIIKMLGGLKAGADIMAESEEALELLRIIYTELLCESEVKLEIAFFPYKASMWDALESIWLAAKDDERCNTTVVPIRYIDRNPDGSITAVHCERDLFPDYVPVTRFEDYDITQETPDIAYIHNPYDGHNYVTSVDPAYYSHELKKHTGVLVYVPYYVSNLKTSNIFVKTACATAADVIVVSSENDTPQFLDHMHEPYKDIVALGSPKVDRILRFEKEKPDMPPEWRDALEGKKVFMLNTSVSSLLQHTDKFLEKIGRIFDRFENRDDAALLWRPHPLSFATINSMRPGLLDGYMELTRRVKSIGVLDETADVTRAIALSDAYIGESASSLLYMYALTGKPLCVLDFDIVKDITAEQRDGILRSVRTAGLMPEEGGKTMLAISADTKEICRIECETGRVVPLADISSINPEDVNSHVFITDCGDKYILPPYNSDKFVELDRDFRLIRTVDVPEKAKADIGFLTPVQYGDYVYFPPCWSRAFARYCISTGEYEYFYDWYDSFAQYTEDLNPHIFSGNHCVVGNKLYLPCIKDNIVAEFNLDTMKFKVYRLGSENNRYQSITYDGKHFWLTSSRPPYLDVSLWRENIVRWDKKTGKVTALSDFPEGFVPGSRAFFGVENCGEYLLVYPYFANMMLRIDPKNGEISEFGAGLIKTFEDEFLPDPKTAAFGATGHLTQDIVYGFIPRERALLTIDVKTGEAQKVKLLFDAPHKTHERTDLKWFIPPGYDRVNHRIFIEHLLFAPGSFVDKVISGEIVKSESQKEFYLRKTANSDGTSGAQIHEYMINKFTDSDD